jgi:hypothetical protein
LQRIRVSEEKKNSVITRCIIILSLIRWAQCRFVLSGGQFLYYTHDSCVHTHSIRRVPQAFENFVNIVHHTHTHTHTHTHPGKLISFFKSSRDAVRCCLCVLPFMVQDRVCGHGNVIFLWQLLHLLVLSYSVCNTFAFFTSWRSQLLRRAFVFSLLLKVRRWKFKF